MLFKKLPSFIIQVFQLLFIKYCFVLLLSLVESKKKNYSFYKSALVKFKFLRSVLSIIESGCFILSFRYLTLADAHSIASLTPVLVVALSAIILREHVSLKTWIAIFVGFVGVLIIMRPGLSLFDPKSLIPLAGAFFLSIYQIVTRKAFEKSSNFFYFTLNCWYNFYGYYRIQLLATTYGKFIYIFYCNRLFFFIRFVFSNNSFKHG